MPADTGTQQSPCSNTTRKHALIPPFISRKPIETAVKASHVLLNATPHPKENTNDLPPKALTLAAFIGMAGMAHALTPDKDDVLGTDAMTIGQALSEQGYELTRFNLAPALIKVTATKDGQRHLMLISPRDGIVISHKTGAARSTQPVTAPWISPIPGLAAKLAEQGYEVKRIKDEGYELESYAMRDGKLWELKLDPTTGAILKAEIED